MKKLNIVLSAIGAVAMMGMMTGCGSTSTTTPPPTTPTYTPPPAAITSVKMYDLGQGHLIVGVDANNFPMKLDFCRDQFNLDAAVIRAQGIFVVDGDFLELHTALRGRIYIFSQMATISVGERYVVQDLATNANVTEFFPDTIERITCQ